MHAKLSLGGLATPWQLLKQSHVAQNCVIGLTNSSTACERSSWFEQDIRESIVGSKCCYEIDQNLNVGHSIRSTCLATERQTIPASTNNPCSKTRVSLFLTHCLQCLNHPGAAIKAVVSGALRQETLQKFVWYMQLLAMTTPPVFLAELIGHQQICLERSILLHCTASNIPPNSVTRLKASL